jgi:hypothetical protein
LGSELGDYFGVSGAAITVRYNKIVKEMAEVRAQSSEVGGWKVRR